MASVQALLLLLDDVLVGATRLARKASQFTLLVLLLCLTLIHSPWKKASNIQLSVAFDSSRHLDSNPRGQVVVVRIPVTTPQWFPGQLLPRLSSS